AVAVDPTTSSYKLVEFTSLVPNSSRPSDWSEQPSLPTDALAKPNRYVLFVAFAPNGKQVAIVANWSSADPSFYQVYLAPWSASGLGAPAPLATAVGACEVAWRSDSAELAVMSNPDCSKPTGDIKRFDLSDPASVKTLVSQTGGDPAWEPLALSG